MKRRRFFTSRSALVALLVSLATSLGACGGSGDPDAGPSLDATVALCTTDSECGDGVYCNGEETCDPDADNADQRGCVAAEAPCAGQRCGESSRTCSSCDVADADGDGHDDIGCGGDDCDDEDANRFPGNIEICDLEDRDEDCDPTTFGPDSDGDGFVLAQCCNVTSDGTRNCGQDCDDRNPELGPDATEVCNGEDEDCDGYIDEGVPHVIYPDADGDGFGVSEEGMAACTLPASGGFSFRGGDCKDDDAAQNPGAPEECDGVDNNCDGAIDEGCRCNSSDAARVCGPRESDGTLLTLGACRTGEQICLDGFWSECVGDQGPAEEFCDGVDDDCDGFIDEGVVRRFYPDADGDGFGDALRPREACRAPLLHVRDRTDCNDLDQNVYPDAVERCDRQDQDCDGEVDESADAWCEEQIPGSTCGEGGCTTEGG